MARHLVGEDFAQREPWGIYHMAGTEVASWYEVACKVFAESGRLGGPVSTVRPIPTSAYPTAAERPKNSRLDTSKLNAVFGVTLPPWQEGIADCVQRLVAPAASPILMSTR
jgi:dTDP-4-dehydrorhamnose reductase